MAILLNNITRFSFPSLSPIKASPLTPPLSISCSISSNNNNINPHNNESSPNPKKKLSEQSSWEAKDSEGNDYLYKLGKEADNMNIAVGARAGVIDPLFAGNFLGKDCKITCFLSFDTHTHTQTHSFASSNLKFCCFSLMGIYTTYVYGALIRLYLMASNLLSFLIYPFLFSSNLKFHCFLFSF